MKQLLLTPREVSERRIIPCCEEEIRCLVRKGDIPAIRRKGRKVLIHY